jgi:hypothetical protein
MRAMRVNGWGVIVLSLALLLPAASSLAQIVNKNFVITDLSDPDTKATITHTGASNSGTGQTTCRNGSNTVTLSVATTHPEYLRFAKDTVTMSQGALGNYPTVRVVGAGAQAFNVVLTCQSASFRSYVNNEPFKNAGTFQVQAASCTGLTLVRATYLNDTCSADTTNTTLRFSVVDAILEMFAFKAKGSTAL